MAHFAEIQNNIVSRVIVVNNNELLENEVESEIKGVEFCKSLFGGDWVQTSYNGNLRKNFAGIGYLYDAMRDAFIAPQPFNSWVLDEATCRWHAPTPRPTPDDSVWVWDENNLMWQSL